VNPTLTRSHDQALRALLLEDSAADAELISDEFDRAGMHVGMQCVTSKEAFARALREFQPDVVLSDHALTQFSLTPRSSRSHRTRNVQPSGHPLMLGRAT
jgi:CheY-like chemotaxis protein